MKIYDVVVYLSSLHKQDPGRKVDTLIAFADGAKKQGADVHIETKNVIVPCKLAVILGWYNLTLDTTNIKLRYQIVQSQKSTGSYIMSIDANCFKFADKKNKWLRYSLNTVEYNTGEFANKDSSWEKWQRISTELGLELKPWKSQGEHILFLVQRDGGWGMKGIRPIDWARNKIQEVRKYSNLPIILRPHPGKVADLKSLVSKNVSISNSINVPITEDLKNAKAALVFNSSSGVASILEGVPLWVDDVSSSCWNVANKNLSTLNSPELFNRSQWIYDLAACHWSDEESSQGLVYEKFLPFLI
jgi:hypothetical protein